MDIEGPNLSAIHELAMVVSRKGYLADSILLHSLPVPDDAQSRNILQERGQYCHCINFKAVEMSKYCVSLDNLFVTAASFIARYPTAVVVSNDQNARSDIGSVMNKLNLPNPYSFLPLSKWVTRVKTFSHQLTLKAKAVSFPIPNSSLALIACPVIQIHSETLRMKRNPSPSEWAKNSSGFHCALYDALEVYVALFLSPEEAPTYRATLVENIKACATSAPQLSAT